MFYVIGGWNLIVRTCHMITWIDMHYLQVRKDRGCVKEIAALKVDCPKACGWKGFLVQFEVSTLAGVKIIVCCDVGPVE